MGKSYFFALLGTGLFLSIGMFRYSYLIGNLATNTLTIAVLWIVIHMRKSGIVSKMLMKLGRLSLYIYLIEVFLFLMKSKYLMFSAIPI